MTPIFDLSSRTFFVCEYHHPKKNNTTPPHQNREMLSVLGTYPLSDGSEYDVEEILSSNRTRSLVSPDSINAIAFPPDDYNDDDYLEAAFLIHLPRKDDRCTVCKKGGYLMKVYLDRNTFSSFIVYTRLHPHLVTERFPKPFGICNGVVVTNGDIVCESCAPFLSFKDWNLQEANEIHENKQRIHNSCFKFVVEQNTNEWMLLRYGPDLMRIGSSAAGSILGVSHYGGPQSLAESILGHYRTMSGEPLVRYRDTQVPTCYTQYGHFYEDYVVLLVELLCPHLCIEEGGICVSTANTTSRLRFAVSVDGEVYNRNTDHKRKNMLAVFEAKSAYHCGHHDQAYKERRVRDQYTNKWRAGKWAHCKWVNLNAHDGIKAEHMAQIHLQMFVRNAKYAIYCTVEWVHWTKPHPEHQIPPFKSMRLIQVPFSQEYWDWAYPRLLRFTDALRGWNGTPLPNTNHPLQRIEDSPPHVSGIVDIVDQNIGVGKLYTEVKRSLDLYEVETRDKAKIAGAWIEHSWRRDEEAGRVPAYDKWW